MIFCKRAGYIQVSGNEPEARQKKTSILSSQNVEININKTCKERRANYTKIWNIKYNSLSSLGS